MIGFVLMIFGVVCLLSPLSAVLERVPFFGPLLGQLVGCSALFVAFAVSSSLSLVTVALVSPPAPVNSDTSNQ